MRLTSLLSHPEGLEQGFGVLPPFLHTNTPFGEAKGADGVTNPVIPSPIPGSGSPFPRGLQPRAAVNTKGGKLFFSSTWPQLWLQDRPLRGHE